MDQDVQMKFYKTRLESDVAFDYSGFAQEDQKTADPSMESAVEFIILNSFVRHFHKTGEFDIKLT